MIQYRQRGGELRQDGGGEPTFFDVVSLALRDVVFLPRRCLRNSGGAQYVLR